MITPHQIAKRDKTEIRQWLFDEFKQVGTDNAEQVSDKLFVLGEGIIVAVQTGQEVSAPVVSFFLISLPKSVAINNVGVRAAMIRKLST